VCAVLLEDGSDCILMPSTTEFAAIEELMKILKPFDDATDILSGETYPTLGIIQPVFHQFLNDVLLSEPGDKDVVKKNQRCNQREFVYKVSRREDVETMLSVAMYLGPQFKKRTHAYSWKES